MPKTPSASGSMPGSGLNKSLTSNRSATSSTGGSTWFTCNSCCNSPARLGFSTLKFAVEDSSLWAVTVDMVKHEIAEAVKAYDKYIICLDKPPDDCETSLRSLMEKAIKAYEN